MSTIVTRSGKGSPLTHTEVDNNFTNLNTDKLQSGDTAASLVITSADINGGTIDGATIGASSASSGVFTSLSDSGNLTFTGTGNRIRGLMDGTPQSNRVAFQTSTTNAQTTPIIIPNGTVGSGTVASGIVWHDSTSSTTGNGSTGSIVNIQSSEIRLTSGIQGTGTYLPIAIHTGGSERLRIDTSGNVGIGTSSPTSVTNYKFVTTQAATGAVYQAYGASSTDARFFADNAYGGTGMFSNHPFLFYTNSSERMRITSDGNVGIGTSSPSTFLNAYNATSAILSVDGDSTTQIRATRYSTDGAQSSIIIRKARGTLASPTAVASADIAGSFNTLAYGGSNFRQITSITGVVDTYTSDTNISGYLTFSTNAGSTSVTERMRITNAGDVGIGTTSPSNQLHVARAGSTYIRVSSTDVGSGTGLWTTNSTNAYLIGAGAASGGSGLEFRDVTNSTTRMILDSSGNLLVGTTSANGRLTVSSASSDAVVSTFANTSASPYGLLTDFTSDPNNATNYGYKFRLTNNTNIYTIFSNGTTSARSDERFKKDIETTRDGYAEDLAKLRVVKYRWHNAEESSPKELGFIAQEVEAVFPNMISTEMNDDGIDVKSIKTSVFVPMLVKAIQEQQAIINDLKARIETLETK
jgi:hypothetical protein